MIENIPLSCKTFLVRKIPFRNFCVKTFKFYSYFLQPYGNVDYIVCNATPYTNRNISHNCLQYGLLRPREAQKKYP